MRDAVICEPVRTPVGRFGGCFRSLSAAQLGELVVRGLLERTGVKGEDVDEVVLGHCFPTSEAPAIGRVVALDAGLPVTVTGMQIDRRCGSGLQAVIEAALQIQTGNADVIIAGGTESMSNAVFYSTDTRSGARLGDAVLRDALTRGRLTAGGRNHPVPGGMLETAENLRRQFHIMREEQDRLALLSHERAVAAQARGDFDDEIVPVATKLGIVNRDEHPRADTTLEALASLPAVRAGLDAEATVTAGNASGQNDGAAVCIVTHRDRAEHLGLRPLAYLRSWAVAGLGPDVMGLGPVPATEGALARAGISMSDVDVIEINEAFAAQVLACTREWKFGEGDWKRTNVAGSGISLGHPVGATGARILATMLREMHRSKARYGLETMCIGGGQGLAAVFEAIP